MKFQFYFLLILISLTSNKTYSQNIVEAIKLTDQYSSVFESDLADTTNTIIDLKNGYYKRNTWQTLEAAIFNNQDGTKLLMVKCECEDLSLTPNPKDNIQFYSIENNEALSIEMEDIIPDYSYYLFFNQKENLNQLLDKFSHMFNNDRETALKGLFQVIYMVPRYNTKLECIIKPNDYTNTNLNDEYPGVSQHDWQLLTEIPNQPIFFNYNKEQKKFILNKI